MPGSRPARPWRRSPCPILWCAITGAVGYGALITSNVVPIRQFGWIMGICTLLSSLLVMVISPAAMLPPFRLELPIRPGSTSRISAGVGRLTGWVYRHPARIVVGLLALVIPVASGMTRLTYESNYINAFKPETRVVRDYRAIESRLGGIGVVEVIVPVSGAITPETLGRFRSVEAGLIGDPAAGPRASYVLSLATVLDPDNRLVALPPEAAARVLATKLDLIAASPQAELLGRFLEPRGPSRPGSWSGWSSSSRRPTSRRSSRGHRPWPRPHSGPSRS